jgi:glycosyltransferase involved in cell wall biosynthesis
MKLIVVTQHVDPDHPALGATVPMLRALAARVDELVVLTDGAAPGALPSNCRVRLFAARTRIGRGLRFLRGLLGELRGSEAVLAHMCPIYAVLAAPVARPRGVRVLLWYTQWHASPTLRVAERAATRVLSVERGSFPLTSRKLDAIGHGVDADELACRGADPGGSTLTVLALGRYSSVKGYATIVRGIAEAVARGLDVRLAVHGPVSNEQERRHRDELAALAAELGVSKRVVLGEALPRPQALAYLARSNVLVSATVRGAADKVVLEAALSCTPVLVPEHAFAGLVPEQLRFRADDPGSLADALGRYANLDSAKRQQLGETLRAPALEGHTVESWADAVVRIASA